MEKGIFKIFMRKKKNSAKSKYLKKRGHQNFFVLFSFPAFHSLNWFSNKWKKRDPWQNFKGFLTIGWLGRDAPGLALSVAPEKHFELHLSQCTSVYSYISWHTFSWCLSSVQCTPNWQQSKRQILTPTERKLNCDFEKKEPFMIFQYSKSWYHNLRTPSESPYYSYAGLCNRLQSIHLRKKTPPLHKKKWGPRKVV